MSSEAGLLLAEQRVQEEKTRILRQRALVEDLRRKGRDLKLACELLEKFEQALTEAKEGLELLRRHPAGELRRKKKARAQETV